MTLCHFLRHLVVRQVTKRHLDCVGLKPLNLLKKTGGLVDKDIKIFCLPCRGFLQHKNCGALRAQQQNLTFALACVWNTSPTVAFLNFQDTVSPPLNEFEDSWFC